MTMLGRHADQDPIDFNRLLLQDGLSKIITYAELAHALISDRDDDGAKLAARGLVAHVRVMQDFWKELGKAYAAEPRRAANASFARPQPEYDQAGHD